MNCFVYKGKKKTDTYLYLDRENDFSAVPEALLRLLGELQEVIRFELDADKKLAQADPVKVMEALGSQGFYLQTPDERDKLPLAGKKGPSHHLPKV